MFKSILQIWHFIETLIRTNKIQLQLSELENAMISTKSLKGMISNCCIMTHELMTS